MAFRSPCQGEINRHPLITASYGSEHKEREGFWGLPAPQAGSPDPVRGALPPDTCPPDRVPPLYEWMSENKGDLDAQTISFWRSRGLCPIAYCLDHDCP